MWAWTPPGSCSCKGNSLRQVVWSLHSQTLSLIPKIGHRKKQVGFKSYIWLCCQVSLNFFRFVFNFSLSISSPEVSANYNFLFEACTILLFITVYFHDLFSVVLHLILRSLRYIYLSFSVILFLCFLCFYAIFSCVLQMLLAFP